MCAELTFDDAQSDDYEALSRDRVMIRSMRASDLEAIISIDAKSYGHERRNFLESKQDEVLNRSGVRVSLVSEDQDGRLTGFLMARVDLGAFGAVEQAAVLDTLGVDPAYARHGIGKALMSQLLVNLNGLHIDTLRTEVSWGRFQLESFLASCGFKPCQRIAVVKTLA